ncbi:hypothetical protein F4677DRAFT_47570 [Hypoxylon crocopeplum]|nr:hypothetical protein F4677DRAFT_47570 [Hypoxylon crocopeplum]
MAIILQIPGTRHGRVSTQPGSIPKKWDREELRRCGAIGTTEPRALNLQGEIHPIFANWEDTDPELRGELEQPLLLASRILEAAGLPWISDFLAHDIFAREYAGRQPSCRCSFPSHSAAAPTDSGEAVPRTIVRHYRAPWATPELKGEWLRAAEARLRGEMAPHVQWQLDPHMFPERGWVGYTCRHPRRRGTALAELDSYDTIRRWDGKCVGGEPRSMTILVAAEFAVRMAELRRLGKEQGEEYLLTAFMAAVTILHELGHAVYWQDCRALTQDLREPFYGADLEMELGDSFVASLFGGWMPVPIKDFTMFRGEAFNFAEGLAWKQSLSWDFHRLRPKHRAHYSIPVDYIARLFSKDCWAGAENDLMRDLVRPQSLELAARGDIGICTQILNSNQHATAAIADFHCTGQGWRWNRLPGARFRIPQYDGYLCPDLDLPVATDDVIEESKPRPPLKPSPVIKPAKPMTTAMSDDGFLSPKPEMFPMPPRRHKININIHNGNKLNTWLGGYSSEEKKKKAKPPPPIIRIAKAEPQVLRPDKPEISLDELRNRLSRLLGVSFDELERFFETSRCA